MLVRLSKNAYVRQYGEFTYVLERITSHDEVFRDAEVFFKWITREEIDQDVLVSKVCEVYETSEHNAVRTDFLDFLRVLEEGGIIVRGENSQELRERDQVFTYDVASPKTMNVRELDWNPDARIPTTILDSYYKEHPHLFGIQVEITAACTERCIHCYCENYRPVHMPFEMFEKVVKEFRAQGGMQVGITGGECMLHPEFDRFAECVRDNDLIVAVLSNLTLCDEDKMRVLKDVEATVQVSLYSMDPKTHDAITRREGSYYETRRAIERFRELDIPCLISCPTMKANFKDYLDVLNFAHSLKMDAQTDFIIMGKRDCDISNTSCRLDLNQTRKIIEDIVWRSLPVNSEYFSLAKKSLMPSAEEWAGDVVCGACINTVSVDVDGNYHPCPGLGGIVLGNCKEHDMNWLLEKSPMMKKMRAIRGRDFVKCVECDDRNYCSVCMCRNFNESGDLFTPAKHFCDVAKINHEVVDAFQRKART